MKAYKPLRGVRVLAFESAFSLPAGTRTLADLGAEVVRVGRPDPVSGPYVTQVDGGRLNKPAVSINLASDAGIELTQRLAAVCDVICNNFRPRVMRRFGLTYEELCKINPRIIVLQLSGYGGPGPWEDYPAYGPSVEAAGAMNYMIGAEDDVPIRVGSGVNADQTGGRYSAFAIMAALEHRRRTGRGQFLDVSMYEGIVHLLGERILAAALTGEPPPRMGNRDPHAAPQGAYPCAGDDDWVALSVSNAAQWRGLVETVGDSALRAPSLEHLEARRLKHDEIDAAISTWTSERDKYTSAALLQQAGVPAAPVEKAEDQPFNPQLTARGAFQLVRHRKPILGFMGHPHLTLPWEVKGRSRPPLEDQHLDNEDNRKVLRKWLGLTSSEVRQLEEKQALLRADRAEVTVGRGMQADFTAGERLGLPRE